MEKPRTNKAKAQTKVYAQEARRLAKLLQDENQRERAEARQKEADRLTQMLAADALPVLLPPREKEEAHAEIQAQRQARRFEPKNLQYRYPRNPVEEFFSLYNKCNIDAPELVCAALESIKYRVAPFQPGSRDLRDRNDNATEWGCTATVAMDIRKAWLTHNLELPEVPVPSCADNPTKQDFMRLEQWFLTARGRTTTNPPLDTPVTLDDFMQLLCTPLKKELRLSRRNSLLGAARRHKITLPAVEGKWESGQSKKYKPIALMEKWNEYRNHLPNLPELKSGQA